MKFKLELVKTESGDLLLKGYCPGETLEFYDLDGEGGKADKITFTPWNQELEAIEGVTSSEYETEDDDSFWTAFEEVIESAKAKKLIPLTDEEIYKALDELLETGKWKFVGNEFHTQREENCDWVFIGTVASKEEAIEWISEYRLED